MEEKVWVDKMMPDDEDSVRSLLTDADLHVNDLYPAKLEHFLVARDRRGAVVGAVGIEPFRPDGLLRSLVVHPDWRGKGLGQRLIEYLERYAREVGIKTLYLLTVTAAEYFPKLGYKLFERPDVPNDIAATEEFRDYCPESAVCFSKAI